VIALGQTSVKALNSPTLNLPTFSVGFPHSSPAFFLFLFFNLFLFCGEFFQKNNILSDSPPFFPPKTFAIFLKLKNKYSPKFFSVLLLHLVHARECLKGEFVMFSNSYRFPLKISVSSCGCCCFCCCSCYCCLCYE